MIIKCRKCGVVIEDEEPCQNGMCIDCFAADWGELVEISPIANPRNILSKKEK